MKTIKFTDDQLLILNEALVKMPFEKVVHLINEINVQIQAQINKEATASPDFHVGN